MYQIDTNEPWPPKVDRGAAWAALQSLKLDLPATPELYAASKAIETAICELDGAERPAAYTRADITTLQGPLTRTG